MKRYLFIAICLSICMLMGACESQNTTSNQEEKEMVYTGEIAVLNIVNNTWIKSLGTKADIADATSGEFLSFCLSVDNHTETDFSWTNAYVIVDNGDEWNWTSNSIPAGGATYFPIYYENMQSCLSEGTHTAKWFFDGQIVCEQQFVITKNMNWSQVFPIPTDAEIQAYTNPNNRRSPYIAGWLTIPSGTKYTEYMIDFKADHVPKGTYCSFGNWTMDYSMLKKQYASVRTEYDGVHAYAGLQNIHDGSKVAIMSFWDVYCTDAAGNTTTLRAKAIYPTDKGYTGGFTGEGEGAQCIVPYEWEEKHWYRMHLKCTTSSTTGNTVVELWFCDLESGENTHVISYDVGVQGSSLMGSIAFFLENYLTEEAGKVRSMEVCNAKYLDATTNQWVNLKTAHLSSNGGVPSYEGSYNFGVQDNKFWMITSGVGGDWYGNGKGKIGGYYTIEK